MFSQCHRGKYIHLLFILHSAANRGSIHAAVRASKAQKEKGSQFISQKIK